MLKTFDGLKEGTLLKDCNGDHYTVSHYDFYGDGECVACLVTMRGIYPASEFDPRDFEIVKGE